MLLLDTHVVLWWLEDDPRLRSSARRAIADEMHVAVSAVTVWEIAIKEAIGRLMPPVDWSQEIEDEGFDPLPIGFAHAVEAARLPRFHADPFDRMLVAQARTEGLVLVTADPKISRYDVPTMAP
jgi:PIN domain nuclease of toxin-antitoxin system